MPFVFGKMKHLLLFIKTPSETRTASLIDIIVAVLLYFTVPIVLSICLFSIFDLVITKTPAVTYSNGDSTFFRLALLVFIEELAFRLPLKHKWFNHLVSSLALSVLLGPLFIDMSRFPGYLFVIIIILFAGLFFLLQFILFKRVKYPFIFYVFAVLFGGLHSLNLSFESIDFIACLYGFLYCFDKIISGVLLGYLRIQTCLLLSFVVHLLYDFLPDIAEYLLSLI